MANIPGCGCIPMYEKAFLIDLIDTNITARENLIRDLRTGAATQTLRQSDASRMIDAHNNFIERAKFIREELKDIHTCI